MENLSVRNIDEASNLRGGLFSDKDVKPFTEVGQIWSWITTWAESEASSELLQCANWKITSFWDS